MDPVPLSTLQKPDKKSDSRWRGKNTSYRIQFSFHQLLTSPMIITAEYMQHKLVNKKLIHINICILYNINKKFFSVFHIFTICYFSN